MINLVLGAIQVRKLLKKINPDILHAHYVTDCGFLGALSGFHPLVLTAWGSDILIEPKRNPLVKTLTKYALSKADLITSDGNNAIEEMKRSHTRSDKFELILLGVDSRKFTPERRDEGLRQKLGGANSPLTISTRNLNPVYDMGTLIRAVPLILQSVPEAKFLIIGEGKQKKYLEDMALSLHVLDSIIFLGRIPHEELPRYLATADIYVSTSLSDTISICTLEAMACELPPIVTDVGDVRKWIQSGENGFIIPVQRPDLLAERIVYLIKNKQLRQKMSKIDRQLIEQRADYEKGMGKAEKLYEELIEGRQT
jgi:glycosyltransferase involved in cell wall biosynthesis